MKSSLQEEFFDTGNRVQPPASDDVRAGAATADSAKPDLKQIFAKLVESIPQPSLQEGMLQVFAELRQLLTYCALVEEEIAQERDLRRTAAIFKAIHKRALDLTDRINVLTPQARADNQALSEALEATGFAFRHEMRRVFGNFSLTPDESTQPTLSRSELARAYGLLHNCFQQSTITLAQVFDPAINGNVLFEDHKLKQEQSVTLYRELTVLLHKMRRVEAGAGILQKLYVINSLKQFQQETMHYLMHRDWAEFESFVNEIIKTYDEAEDLNPVFHRFSGYLETLLRHVSMRAVLNDKPLCPTAMVF